MDGHTASTTRQAGASQPKGHLSIAGERPRRGSMFDAPLPSRETACAPGTEGKVETMRLRASRREQLFHPSDAELDVAEVAWGTLVRLWDRGPGTKHGGIDRASARDRTVTAAIELAEEEEFAA